ncbi:hypothetical protein APHNP_0398 [Anaplasma phagocytophilum str. ApNP]|uniref:Uncharacterized protein n=1 Tax=Anaplasma phagocytophilum str. ApNP TaxID=1359153 RepID=A0A0F3NGE1_ANAPH|nr:hypothetical protein APHNP_0398 [Anaplasma phagocytophilum str. ApNP]
MVRARQVSLIRIRTIVCAAITATPLRPTNLLIDIRVRNIKSIRKLDDVFTRGFGKSSGKLISLSSNNIIS